MMQYLRYSLVFFFLVNVFALQAQEPQVLPKGMTNAEKGLVSEYQFTSTRLTPPPSMPVRAAAEWEEIEYLMVSWNPGYPNILRQIVAAGVEECKVIVITENETNVSNYLTSNGVSLDNVIFMDEETNSIWIRDYGPNTIYQNDIGQRAITDWIYNRPRPDDDVIPSAIASYIGIPFYSTDSGTNDLVNTGGNYMSDGLGTGFASELVLEENEAGNPYGVSAKTEAEVDAIMNAYMGLDRYIKMETLPFDGIHHIDMHMKLLDEETLLVSEYPEGVADGPQIEENIQYVLDNFQSAFGKPYQIERIPAPPSTSGNYPDNGGWYRTYTNMTFVNGTVLLPIYRPEVDGPAIAQLQELLPGYNIVGIDVDESEEPLIGSLGAIHCITHTVGVADPLWIVHDDIEEGNAGSTIPVEAMIRHNSGVSQASVFWRETGATEYTEVAMSAAGDNMWTADLTLPSEEIDVEYYIWAEANSGKSLARPIVAPDGYWTINVASLATSDWAAQNIVGPYPNPATDVVRFELGNIESPLEVTLHSILGQELFTEKVEANGTLTLTLNPTWQGTLFVTFKGNFGTVTKKLLVR